MEKLSKKKKITAVVRELKYDYGLWAGIAGLSVGGLGVKLAPILLDVFGNGDPALKGGLVVGNLALAALSMALIVSCSNDPDPCYRI